MRVSPSRSLNFVHNEDCVACGGTGVKAKRQDRRKYRYFVAVYHEVWPLAPDDIEEEHGPLRNDQYLPSGLKYTVNRCPISYWGEKVRGNTEGWTECLTSCGRFTREWTHSRTFASDREADRTVERLASGLPVFITRAVALAATFGVVLPAWTSALVMLFG